MNIMSFNINGIRASSNRGLVEYLKTEPADIICLQEVRAPFEVADKLLKELGYYVFINPAEKKGYSGTAVLSKVKPLSVKYTLEGLSLWTEGRIIVLEFDNCFVVNCYVPHGGTRLEVKLDFLEKLLVGLNKLRQSGKTVILASDINIAHTENDLSHPKVCSKMTGFLDIERNALTKFVEAGFIDSYREFYDGKAYSWSSYRSKFGQTYGLESWNFRFDYILVNSSNRSAVVSANILYDKIYSDHYPVIAEINI